jgi:hypothetical protein
VVNVRGIVTVQPGQHRAQGDDMYIQDASGAVKIFSNLIGGWNVQIGDLVDVTAVAASSRQRDPAGQPGGAQRARARGRRARAAGDDHRCYAATQGARCGARRRPAGAHRARAAAGPSTLGGGRNARFNDGSGPVEIRIDAGVVATTANINGNFTVGACYNVTGSLTPFGGAAQVKPRSMADFQEVPCN